MWSVNSLGLFELCLLTALSSARTLPIDEVADNMDILTTNSANQIPDQPLTLVESLRLNVYGDSPNSAKEQDNIEVSIKTAGTDLADETEHFKLAKRELSVQDPNAYAEDFDMEVAEIHVFLPKFRYSVEYAKKVQNQRQQQFQQFG